MIPPPPPAPTFKLLFSFLTPRGKLVLLAPAIAASVVAGSIAPFMTYVVGQSFDAFAVFPLAGQPSQRAQDALLHGVGLTALQLTGLGWCALVMSSVTNGLWVMTGEWNVIELQRKVYRAVVHAKMEWFDRQMGSDNPTDIQDMDGEGVPVGAGGLMAKFARETDDVRAASSIAAGQFIQYSTTTISALTFAFVRSPLLTLVILSVVPFLILIQGFSEAIAGPRLARERTFVAHAASLVSRVVSNISAVKAANAAAYEHTLLTRVEVAVQSLGGIWATTCGATQFVTMAMFVQGFWYGAHLVLRGKNQPGDVMSIFWACLIATSNLQMIVPLLAVLTKGKTAAAELASVITSSQQVAVTVSKHRKAKSLLQIIPHSLTGDVALTNITFSYPTRPIVPVLRDVDMYFPSQETTFIVGPSGCGKSTIGSILLGCYTPELGKGDVLLDEQDVRYLDTTWVRRHVAGVTQGSAGVGAQVFRGSIHWNVALGAVGSGRPVEDVTRAEVEEACRLAMLERWVLGLDAGYETILFGSGENTGSDGGVVLSGGMRQRLALARARIRDPEVLILDESTSALDPTARFLTTAAIRAWRSRAQKTTIIITHDLTCINADDFVYVMRDGRVADQGLRADLEKGSREWHDMLRQGGRLDKDDQSDTMRPPACKEDVHTLHSQDEDTEKMKDKRRSIAPTLQGVPLVTTSIGEWVFDVVIELTKMTNGNGRDGVPPLPVSSGVVLNHAADSEGGTSWKPRRHTSIPLSVPSPLKLPPRAYHPLRLSLQPTPTSSTISSPTSRFVSATKYQSMVRDYEQFECENLMKWRAGRAAGRRREGCARRAHGVIIQGSQCILPDSKLSTPESLHVPGLIATLRRIYPTIPSKHVFFLGFVASLMSGALTPIFSFLLSRLMYQVSANPGAATIDSYAPLVLGIAAADGLFMGFRCFLMDLSSIRWVTRLRNIAYLRVLSQDKAWFDSPAHSPATIAQTLVKDGDDARTLVAVVVAQLVAAMAMMSLGLVWALVWGWQLTLVGIAICPIFVGAMALQASLASECESKNKRAREEVARVYYETILNIRSIRAMSLDSVLQSQFDKAISVCLTTSIRGAFIEGCTYGVSSGLIYLSEALLFYVGAILIANGTYTYLQMIQVLCLVLFTVTTGSQTMAFTQQISKSVKAITDLLRFVTLPTDGTRESQGVLRPPIGGDLVLKDVSFSYPTNPDTTVLKDFSVKIPEGECVALVGASGCGKSTIAALLQRLYEPTSGTISIGQHELRWMDVHHLRNHVGVVSQTPNLFDGTIRDNIAYGHLGEITDEDIVCAARAANVHDFVMSLPQGYDTLVGENASRISGGQAQRLQIARALARPSRILVLDECTSALDGANQAAILETIRSAKAGRTTVMVTHKVEVMQMCDRVVVIEDGKVAEEGRYDELVDRGGLFAKLASGGEWLGD